MTQVMKVVGSACVAGARGTHEICQREKGFQTSCGIILETVDKNAVELFLNSKRGPIHVSCPRCPEQRVRRNLRSVRSHLRKGG